MNTLKKCFKCNKDKDINDFYKHFGMADGHLNKCKECTKKDVTKHREDNIEKVRAYDRSRGMLPHRIAARKEYQKTEAGKEARNRGQRKYRKTEKGRRANHEYIKQHPDRIAAGIILNNAVRDKRIQKKPCEFCGSTINIHGHHEDYGKPLEVIWMCAQCHKDYHAQNTS